jgi:hypothetical protein
VWIEHSQAELRQKPGKWAVPKPPLFPGAGGRRRQRAFRDALTDLLPPDNGFLPTLRIAYFEVKSWIGTEDAPVRMKELLDHKIFGRGQTFDEPQSLFQTVSCKVFLSGRTSMITSQCKAYSPFIRQSTTMPESS